MDCTFQIEVQDQINTAPTFVIYRVETTGDIETLHEVMHLPENLKHPSIELSQRLQEELGWLPKRYERAVGEQQLADRLYEIMCEAGGGELTSQLLASVVAREATRRVEDPSGDERLPGNYL